MRLVIENFVDATDEEAIIILLGERYLGTIITDGIKLIRYTLHDKTECDYYIPTTDPYYFIIVTELESGYLSPTYIYKEIVKFEKDSKNNVIDYKVILANLVPFIQGGIANERQIKIANKLIEWARNDRRG